MTGKYPGTYVLTFSDGDVRECERYGDTFVHVLNRAYEIAHDDPRITKVTHYEGRDDDG
jgi:hypothetical protein